MCCLTHLTLRCELVQATVSKAATALAGDFGGAWQAARDGWQTWWASVFDKKGSVPTALPFEGQLPVLSTDDAAL